MELGNFELLKHNIYNKVVYGHHIVLIYSTKIEWKIIFILKSKTRTINWLKQYTYV